MISAFLWCQKVCLVVGDTRDLRITSLKKRGKFFIILSKEEKTPI